MGSILDVKSSGLGSVKRSVKGFVNKKRKPIGAERLEAKRKEKERIRKKEERAEKHSYKMSEKAYDRETKKQLKKLGHEHKKELAQIKKQPKYNKWGDRIS